MEFVKKTKIAIILNNTNKISGPTTAMRRIKESFLSNEFIFDEIILNDRLGKIPRVKVIFRLIRELKKINPDIVHITGLQLHGFYAVLAARLAGYQKILVTVRGSSGDSLSINKFQKAIFSKIIEPITLRLSYQTYTVCNEMANNPIVKKNCKNFWGVLYNPAPIIKINDFNREQFRNEFGIHSDDILAVYTGRVVYEKGLDFALAAASKIDNALFKFIIVGEGEDLQKYTNIYHKEITIGKFVFTGKRTDVLNILRGCDIFIFPTLHENLSNSLLEACSMGLAIIATNVGGNPEVIRDGIDGILVESCNENQIYKSINTLLEDDKMRNEYGKNAQNRMYNIFSSAVIYRQLASIYKGLIQ